MLANGLFALDMNIRSLLLSALLAAVTQLSCAEGLPPGLLAGLASENFSAREKSQQELLGWAREKSAKRAAPLLGLLADEDPEIRKRSSEILRQLSDDDYLSNGQGYLGIMMGEEMFQEVPDGKLRAGIRISRVIDGSPADLSGLKAGDMITALDGKAWEEQGALDAFMGTIAGKKPLSDAVLTIRRNAPEQMEITVKLGKRPIPDLNLSREDPQILDMQAKDEHYKEWLKRLKPD